MAGICFLTYSGFIRIMNLERRHSSDNSRSRETEVERLEARLEKNRRTAADRRARETQEEKESRREKERIRSAKCRSTSALPTVNMGKQANAVERGGEGRGNLATWDQWR